MAKKPKKEHHENHERYLVTYSDLITLLLAFFIILYAMSKLDPLQYDSFARSMHVIWKTSSMDLVNLQLNHDQNQSQTEQTAETRQPATPQEMKTMQAITEDQSLQEVQKMVEQKIRENPDLISKVTTNLGEDGLYIVLSSDLTFESGKAVLTDKAKQFLDEVIPLFQDLPEPVRISGHTDNVPISSALYPSNWELSTARAVAVLREILAVNPPISPNRLSASGYGEYKPVADNSTAEGRQANRRVEILIERLHSEGLLQPKPTN